MSNLLDQYQLKFTKRQYKDFIYPVCMSDQQNIQVYLAGWISILKNNTGLNTYINDINAVIDNQIAEDVAVDDIHLAVKVTPTTTYIMEFEDYTYNDFNNPDYSLPTIDYRNILVEWKDYLEKM